MNALGIDIVVRVTVLVAICLAMLFALRRSSAACRHFIGLAGLIAILGVIPSRLLLPAANLALLPAPPSETRLAVPSPNFDASSETQTEFTATTKIAANPSQASPTVDWFLAVWLAGVGLVAGRVALGIVRTRRRSSCAAVATDPRLSTLAIECKHRLGVRKDVQLRIEPVSDTVSSPITFGSRKPVLLLPSDISTWPDDRIRGALLHELAHVRRNDWINLLISHAVTALFWFHALIWILARQARASAEQAADDLVLASGLPAFDYAQQLVELARTLRPSRPDTTALAMASSGKLEARLMRLMNRSHSRRPISLKSKGLAVGLFAGLALSVSAIHFTERQAAQTATEGAAVVAQGPKAGSLTIRQGDGTATLARGSSLSGARLAKGKRLRASQAHSGSSARAVNATMLAAQDVTGTTIRSGGLRPSRVVAGRAGTGLTVVQGSALRGAGSGSNLTIAQGRIGTRVNGGSAIATRVGSGRNLAAAQGRIGTQVDGGPAIATRVGSGSNLTIARGSTGSQIDGSSTIAASGGLASRLTTSQGSAGGSGSDTVVASGQGGLGGQLGGGGVATGGLGGGRGAAGGLGGTRAGGTGRGSSLGGRAGSGQGIGSGSGQGDGWRERLGSGKTNRERLLNGASLSVRGGHSGDLTWGLVLTDGDSRNSFSYGDKGIEWREKASVDKLLVISNGRKLTITDRRTIERVIDVYVAQLSGDYPVSVRDTRVASIIQEAISSGKAS